MEISKMLSTYKSVAVVGVSDRPDRPSHEVAKYLIEKTPLNVYLVNPMITELFGKTVYPSLSDIPASVDIVDIFRKSEEIPALVPEAAKIGAKVFWMQLGLTNQAALDAAIELGLEVVEDKCLKIEWEKNIKNASSNQSKE